MAKEKRGGKYGASKVRTSRGQLNQLWGEQALEQIKKDMNVDDATAQAVQNAFYNYSGGNSTAIRNGDDFDAYYIEEYIAKAPVYNGEIYRGMRFYDNDAKAQTFVSKLQEGATIEMGGISSWTSSASVAKTYAGGSSNDFAHKITFISKNKSGVGIQHLSLYGSQEAEVLHSSNVKFKITKVEITTLNSWKGGKEYKVYVDEV